MYAKDKLVLSSHKLPTWFMTPALSNCINIKCKKEHIKLNKNKYVIEKKNLLFKMLEKKKKIKENFKNDEDRRNIEFKKLDLMRMKDRAKLKIKIIKEKDHNNFINCQLKNCYNKSINTLKILIENILAHTNKNTEEFKLASKYNKLFKENKLTVKDIKIFDIKMMKIKLKEYIRNHKISMMKLKKKEMN
jgi:hypothetical protein